MDIFNLRKKVVGDYRSYIHSFLKILDPHIEKFVNDSLEEGVLWPDPLLQLSPAYQSAETVEELAQTGFLHPLCAQLFRAGGKSLRLHQHQRSALATAAQGHHYVVTTGTGSGKSLTYILPIFDHVLRNQPETGKVRAIIVYPMNALINSQEQALDRFVDNLPGGKEACPVRYARYTGQESEGRKHEIQNQPPHILLTNYVMLELMLTRPEERTFVEATRSALQFLVLDELHTYRGRQGADVALLVRRLRERCGNPGLQCIGTSATMSTGVNRIERNKAVAEVAGKIFGVSVEASHIIDETLRQSLSGGALPQPTSAALKAALTNPPALLDLLNWETLRKNPLAGWIEENFGLEEEQGGRLRRRDPITLLQGAQRLADLTGLDKNDCVQQLQRLFNAGSRVRSPEDTPGFAFKLHQFFSQGGSVYATIEPPGQRYLTLEGQHYAPGPGDRLLYPLVFCRECGQEHYLCIYEARVSSLTPRPPSGRDETSAAGREVQDGYFLVDVEGFWADEQLDLLPESWFKELKRGRELKPEYIPFRPRRLWVSPNGTLEDRSREDNVRGWFIPTPFLTCLRCGEVYTRRQNSDFGKLARLSSEGRSTATTLLSLSTIVQMRRDPDLKDNARKLLSFTDNRQDASLQAGHFNDFVEVGLLRAAIYRALVKNPQGLTHTGIAPATLEELNLPEAVYAQQVSSSPRVPLAGRNRSALQDLLEYRVYEDLRRGWRVTQPNLEQCGLLLLDYESLDEVCGLEELWEGHPLLAQTPPASRQNIARTLLDYMRRELAISAACLERPEQEALLKRIRLALKEPWAFDENEVLYSATMFVLPGTPVAGRGERSLSANTGLGRYLRSRQTWPDLTENLGQEEYARLVRALVETLLGAGYLQEVEAEQGKAVQVRSDTLIWRAGQGSALPRDPIRTRRMKLDHNRQSQPNVFFASFYRDSALSLQTIEGREHTGQVSQKDREKREDRFRQGNLAALFCSPTMELGIDIADLNVVHLRNVPPTPANYAQRSGRAGRSGQPALVATYCSVGSGHDQYFFRRPQQMVAGAVVPPRLDLGNEELLQAHIHAVWLSTIGLKLSRSMIHVVDTTDPVGHYPLLPEVQQALELSTARYDECLTACQRLMASTDPDLTRHAWYSPQWLTETISRAASEFDRACDRWRELYAAAERQLQEARAATDQRYQSRRTGTAAEAEDARRREREALRQKDLLCNDPDGSQQGDTDFYPYRYFASEGFLPGYNFPRLPVQAFLPTSRESGTFLARPRFLALTEFGPRNVIYHEGGKYRVTKVILPGGSATSRLVTAKLCQICGFYHEGHRALLVERCEHCGTRLDASTSLTTDQLFELTTVATQRIERITSEEEERVREGYYTTSHFRFSDTHGTLTARNHAPYNDQSDLLELCYAPVATLWRINHRWRRATSDGFTLDLKKGLWAKRPGDESDATVDIEGDGSFNGPLTAKVRLLVRDTRNLLLLRAGQDATNNESILASLQYALQRGLEAVFQVEEQELISERIGEDNQRRILLWEAAEGGVGVLTRLVEERQALAQVASRALEICHFDPQTGQERSEEVQDCGRACYRCLLSYANQPDHALINRHAVRNFLLTLAGSLTEPYSKAGTASENEANSPGGGRDDHYEHLLTQVPKDSFLEKVIAHLYTTRRSLPTAIRPQLADEESQPDLYFAESDLCVFCDEIRPVSARIQAQRDDLADAGYLVMVVGQDQDLEAQLLVRKDLFGEPKQ